jgi:hypothetical protein
MNLQLADRTTSSFPAKTAPPSSSVSRVLAASPRASRAHELRRSVLNSLLRSGYAPLNFIACEICGNRVILEGIVPSYHLKQLAQVYAQKVDGVGRVENRLVVRRSRA